MLPQETEVNYIYVLTRSLCLFFFFLIQLHEPQALYQYVNILFVE